jgi:hypothetical protein
MHLPVKKYYSLKEAADQWDCTVDDLLYYATTGDLQICVQMDDSPKLKKKYHPKIPRSERIGIYTFGFNCDSGVYGLSKEEVSNIRRGKGISGVEDLKDKEIFYMFYRFKRKKKEPPFTEEPTHDSEDIKKYFTINAYKGDIAIADFKKELKDVIEHIKKKFPTEDLVITNEEKLRFEKECVSDKPVPKSEQLVDEFVRSLTIYPENDETINIQIPGRKAEPFTGPTLGFNKIIGGKQWRLLQKIIQEGRYYIGSTKTNDGDARRKCLTTVSKKMIKFLNEKFPVKIPPNYKLFEKPAGNKEGTWKPKFNVQPAKKSSGQTLEQILEKLKAELYKEKSDQDVIQDLYIAAKEKGISNEELMSIYSSEHKDKEVYDYEEGGHIINKP